MKIHNNKEFAESEVDKIINEIDTNSSGVVDFTGRINLIKYFFLTVKTNSFDFIWFIIEFIVASMNREKMLSKQRTEMTFKMFDTVSPDHTYLLIF